MLTSSPLHVQEPVAPSAGTRLGWAVLLKPPGPKDELSQLIATGDLWAAHLPGPACVWKGSKKPSCELHLQVKLFS